MDYDERNMNGQVKGGKRVNEGQNEVGREEKAVKLPMINVKGNVREGNMKEEKRERGKRGI